MSVLLYGCTTWILIKCLKKKKHDGKYIRMLCAVLNKSWMKHSTKQQLYGHLPPPPVSQTIQVKWVRQVKLISNISLWSLTHGHTSVGHPAKTYIHQLCADSRCLLEDLLSVMISRDGWQESQRDPCCWYALIKMTLYLNWCFCSVVS